MNISKNLLSLGLIAVISGISTAQTYTATAGTNGITDIQSDYSMSTGDGASVSVDVPLEFELPKKVAIAITENGTKNFPVNSMFEGIVPYFNTRLAGTLSLTPYDPSVWNNMSASGLDISGGIYANSAISVTVESTDFFHETDPNSQFSGRENWKIGKKVASAYVDQTTYYNNADSNESSSSLLPVTVNIDDSQLMAEENKLSFYYNVHPYLDTIDPSDRAGKYTSVITITASTL